MFLEYTLFLKGKRELVVLKRSLIALGLFCGELMIYWNILFVVKQDSRKPNRLLKILPFSTNNIGSGTGIFLFQYSVFLLVIFKEAVKSVLSSRDAGTRKGPGGGGRIC